MAAPTENASSSEEKPRPSTIDLAAPPTPMDDIAASMGAVLGFGTETTPTEEPAPELPKPAVEGNDLTEEEPIAAADEEAGGEQEAVADEDEGISTLSELAGAMEIEEDALLSQLHVANEDGSQTSLADVVAAYRAAPEAVEAAAERDTLEQQFGTRKAELQRDYDVGIDVLRKNISLLHENLYSNLPDPTALATIQAEDPERFAQMQVEAMNKQQAIDHGMQALDAYTTQRESEFQKQQGETKELEDKRLARAWPEYVHAESGPGIQSQMKSYLGGIGFNGDEIDAIVDSRTYRVIRDAMRGSAMKKAGKKAVELAREKGLRKPRPGPAARAEDPTATQRKLGRVDELKSQHAKHGSVESAAAAFKEMLG